MCGPCSDQPSVPCTKLLSNTTGRLSRAPFLAAAAPANDTQQHHAAASNTAFCPGPLHRRCRRLGHAARMLSIVVLCFPQAHPRPSSGLCVARPLPRAGATIALPLSSRPAAALAFSRQLDWSVRDNKIQKHADRKARKNCLALPCCAGVCTRADRYAPVGISRATVSPAALRCPSRPGNRTKRNADEANPASAFSALLDDSSPAASTGVDHRTSYARVRALYRMHARAHISLRMPKTCSCVTVASCAGRDFQARALTPAPRTSPQLPSTYALCSAWQNASLLTVVIPCAGLGTRVGLPYP